MDEERELLLESHTWEGEKGEEGDSAVVPVEVEGDSAEVEAEAGDSVDMLLDGMAICVDVPTALVSAFSAASSPTAAIAVVVSASAPLVASPLVPAATGLGLFVDAGTDMVAEAKAA
jgi:hypothetical protein